MRLEKVVKLGCEDNDLILVSFYSAERSEPVAEIMRKGIEKTEIFRLKGDFQNEFKAYSELLELIIEKANKYRKDEAYELAAEAFETVVRLLIKLESMEFYSRSRVATPFSYIPIYRNYISDMRMYYESAECCYDQNQNQAGAKRCRVKITELEKIIEAEDRLKEKALSSTSYSGNRAALFGSGSRSFGESPATLHADPCNLEI
ncbi:MAG: hypothetical protein COY58_05890 [Gammaproteobacteria bacterium CG_4_10_14_0_8_um_filter_38_16]|nr:MAG: hypothetical protein COY58_05890 [Gammaproteobacteria bacterium CG_4_10_14_0_8_um_filter_38_16]PJA04418.1 MAG: hypothetical protein COX72_00500 [Gammaproteobacteria bacterium CG_4_10_14_0_2_um_filter_38_22]PJB10160.1 MAG: hypothetical protein CO120_06080 [Gammaproteobacteria bacterium CG_4_9_14_3_um_filter_38_9]